MNTDGFYEIDHHIITLKMCVLEIIFSKCFELGSIRQQAEKRASENRILHLSLQPTLSLSCNLLKHKQTNKQTNKRFIKINKPILLFYLPSKSQYKIMTNRRLSSRQPSQNTLDEPLSASMVKSDTPRQQLISYIAFLTAKNKQLSKELAAKQKQVDEHQQQQFQTPRKSESSAHDFETRNKLYELRSQIHAVKIQSMQEVQQVMNNAAQEKAELEQHFHKNLKAFQEQYHRQIEVLRSRSKEQQKKLEDRIKQLQQNMEQMEQQNQALRKQFSKTEFQSTIYQEKIARITKAKETAENDKNTVLEDQKHLKRSIEELRVRVELQNDKIKDLESQLEKHRTEVEKKERECQKLKRYLESSESKRQVSLESSKENSAGRKMQNQLAETQVTIQAQKNEIQALSKAVGLKDKLIERLQVQIEDVSRLAPKKSDGNQNFKDDLQKTICQLQSKIQTISNQSQEEKTKLNSTIKSLRVVLQQKEMEIERTNSELKNIKKNISRSEDRNQELAEKIRKLETEINRKNQEIKQLQANNNRQVETLKRDKLYSQQQLVKKHEQQQQRLQLALEQLKAELTEYKSQNQKCRSRITQLESEKQAAIHLQSSYQSISQQLKSRIVEQESLRIQLSHAAQNHLQQLSIHQQKIKTLLSQIEIQKQAKLRLQNQLNRLQNQQHSEKSKMQTLSTNKSQDSLISTTPNNQLQHLKDVSQSALKLNTKLTKQVEECHSHITMLNDTIQRNLTSHLKETSELTKKLALAQQDLNTSNRKLQDKESTIGRLKGQLQQTEKDLADCRKQKDELHRINNIRFGSPHSLEDPVIEYSGIRKNKLSSSSRARREYNIDVDHLYQSSSVGESLEKTNYTQRIEEKENRIRELELALFSLKMKATRQLESATAKCEGMEDATRNQLEWLEKAISERNHLQKIVDQLRESLKVKQIRIRQLENDMLLNQEDRENSRKRATTELQKQNYYTFQYAKSEVQQVRGSLIQLRQQYKQLEAQLNRTKQQNMRLNIRCTTLTTQLEGKKKNITKIVDAKSKELTEIETNVQKYIIEVEQLNEWNRQLQNQILELREQSSKDLAKMKEAKLSNSNLTEENECLRGKIEDLKSELKSVTKHKLMLQQDKQRLEAEIGMSKTHLASLKLDESQRIKTQNQMIQNIKSQLDNQNNIVKERQEEIAVLSKRLESERRQLQRTISNKEKEVQKLTNSLIEEKAKVKKLQVQNQARAQKNDILSLKCDQLLEETEKQMQSSRLELKQLEKENRELRSCLQEQKEQNVKKEQLAKRYSQKLQSQARNIVDIQEYTRLAQEHRKCTNSHEEISRQLQTAKQELVARESTILQLQIKINELQGEFGFMKVDCETQLMALKDGQKSLQNSQEAITSLRERCISLQRINKTLTQTISENKQELTRLEVRIQLLQETNHSLIAQNSQLNNQIRSFRVPPVELHTRPDIRFAKYQNEIIVPTQKLTMAAREVEPITHSYSPRLLQSTVIKPPPIVINTVQSPHDYILQPCRKIPSIQIPTFQASPKSMGGWIQPSSERGDPYKYSPRRFPFPK